MVRAFAHGAMGRRIEPSWWTHLVIARSSQCSTTGVTKAVVCAILSVAHWVHHYAYMASDIRHMVKDHLNRERKIAAATTWDTLFRLATRVSTDRIAHTTTFVLPVVERWLERKIALWVHHEGSIRRPIAP